MLRSKHLVIFIVLFIGMLLGMWMTLVIQQNQAAKHIGQQAIFGESSSSANVTVPNEDTRTAQRDALLAQLKQQQDTTNAAPGDTQTPSTPATTETPTTTAAASPDGAIPLGDGKVGTSPKQGYVYSCTQSFRGGGADHAGDWIAGSYWYPDKKIAVEGSVTWPAQISFKTAEGARLVTGNGLPEHPTGIFPIQSTDPAYQYDRNPNAIESQNILLQLPEYPTAAATPSCVPMGMVGIALDGTAIYNALDDAGRDAVAHEVQDSCDGHPQSQGQYHYHGPSPCMPHATENNALVGYALDGFGIYSMYDASGKEYTNDELDACHGLVSEVMWDGKITKMYHYVLTKEYPYTLGCFKGTPVRSSTRSAPQAPGGGGTGGNRLPPPPSALPPQQ